MIDDYKKEELQKVASELNRKLASSLSPKLTAFGQKDEILYSLKELADSWASGDFKIYAEDGILSESKRLLERIAKDDSLDELYDAFDENVSDMGKDQDKDEALADPELDDPPDEFDPDGEEFRPDIDVGKEENEVVDDPPDDPPDDDVGEALPEDSSDPTDIAREEVVKSAEDDPEEVPEESAETEVDWGEVLQKLETIQKILKGMIEEAVFLVNMKKDVQKKRNVPVSERTPGSRSHGKIQRVIEFLIPLIETGKYVRSELVDAAAANFDGEISRNTVNAQISAGKKNDKSNNFPFILKFSAKTKLVSFSKDKPVDF